VADIGFRIKRKIIRPFLKSRTNYPFLSSDVFAEMADINFNQARTTSNVDHQITSLFAQSHYANQIAEILHYFPSLEMVIFGNSDFNFSHPIQNLEDSNLHFLAQNLEFVHPNYSPLPIGLENFRLYWNGIPKSYSADIRNIAKENRLLVGPFSPTHPERLELHKFSNSRGLSIDFFNTRFYPREYSRLASRYKFVAAPQGNGRDTHRFWEALYRGSYPIVLRSEWSKQIKLLGIPCVEIDSWTFEAIEQILHSDYPVFDPLNVPLLWAQNWMKKIDARS